MNGWVFLVFGSLLILLVRYASVGNEMFEDWSFTPLANRFKQPILKFNTFYQQLPEESKKLFDKKVKYFINTKEFIARDMSNVTDEMQAMIASAAVQLTFGLPDVSLLHFNKILIYPTDYYSVISRQYHKGEVNPRLKAIVLSWNDFVAGFVEPYDGVNLGLHEMAHALKLENIIQNGEHHFFDLEEYMKWLELAKEEIVKIRAGEDSMFRKYASVDEDEFFAVCVEVYFEQPHKLFENNPALYKSMSNLLNQDTIQLYGKSSG